MYIFTRHTHAANTVSQVPDKLTKSKRRRMHTAGVKVGGSESLNPPSVSGPGGKNSLHAIIIAFQFHLIWLNTYNHWTVVDYIAGLHFLH